MSACQPFRDGQLSGFLHTPEGPHAGSLVLTHGAGANCQAPLLAAVAQAFQNAGYYVLRCDLPFRQARRFGPPHPSQAAADREGLRTAVIALRRIAGGPVCLGGHSYGGRQASMLAAEDPELAQRLLLLSYPLHPPRKPEQLRTAHFPNLRTPALFVHGDADPFGGIEEMNAALGDLSAPYRLSIVEKAGHDLKRGKLDLPAQIVLPFDELLTPSHHFPGSAKHK
ncbi:MAG TPA: alpha/beta fold hydrolase [Bryobacteraceae bacterium]|nr:alpha/beta fold hydrolase [Bryobacteraceae bacterium]